MKFERILGQLEAKKLFAETIIQKLFETNSCERGPCGKSSISIFQQIFRNTDKIFISRERLTTRQ